MSLMAVATMASTSSYVYGAYGIEVDGGTGVVAGGETLGRDSLSPIPTVGMARAVASLGRGPATM